MKHENPQVGVSAFIQETTRVKIETLTTGAQTLEFDGDNYGAVTLFLGRDKLAEIRDVINEFLAGDEND